MRTWLVPSWSTRAPGTVNACRSPARTARGCAATAFNAARATSASSDTWRVNASRSVAALLGVVAPRAVTAVPATRVAATRAAALDAVWRMEDETFPERSAPAEAHQWPFHPRPGRRPAEP